MRRDPKLQRIPVIVISASDNPLDVSRVYNAQGSLFLQKPIDISAYFRMIRSLKELWLHFAIFASG